MQRLLVILLCAIAAVSARATTYHVGAGGSDANTGLSYVQRFATVVKGVQTATSPGDIVQIDDAGVYNESLNNIFPSGTAGNLITLQTTNGLRATLRPAAGADWVAHFANAQTEYYRLNGLILDGTNVNNDVVKITSGSRFITLTNCDVVNSPDGHGVLMSTPDGFRGSDGNQILNCKISTNGILHYGGGTSNHGVYTSTDSNIVDGCEISNNQDHGIHNFSAGDNNIFRNNRLHNNQAGIGIYSSIGALSYNNICYSNNIGFRAGSSAQQVRFYNNAAWKNGSNFEVQGGIVGWVALENNIASECTDSQSYGFWIQSSGQTVTNRYNLSFDNLSGRNYQNDNGANTIAGNNDFGDNFDAQWVNPANIDFHIGASSSARNTGTAQSAFSTDFEGTSRPQESVWDKGPHEYSSGGQLPTVTVNATDDTATELDTTTGTFTFTRAGSTTGALTVNFTLTGSTATSGVDYTSIGTSIVIADGQSTATKTVTPIDDPDPEADEIVKVTISTDAAYTVGSPDNATVTIRDNDAPGGTLTQRNIPPRGQSAILF